MFFEQVVHADMGCASYVVASSVTHEAMVVDPRWAIEPYLDIARSHGFRITRIVETHTHADHVSGHGRLAEATSAAILIHSSADVEYEHEMLSDGQIIDIGDIRVHVIHTPGHRPEHIALAIEDVSRGADPWMILTGDSLMVGDVARPDLAVDGAEGASLLFDSLHTKLLVLPEFVAVYPGHVAGSLCGRVSSEVLSTTLGYEKRFNAALAIDDRDQFIMHMTQNLPHRPPNMAAIVAENRGPLQSDSVRIQHREPRDAQVLMNGGVIAVDVRDTDSYLDAHISRSLHVSVSGPQFGTRAGFVLSLDQPTLLVASSREEAELAATSLRSVGQRHANEYVLFDQWRSSGLPVTSIPQMKAGELSEQLGNGITVLDVRDRGEWNERAVPGTVNVPYSELEKRTGELPMDDLIAVMCGSGGRSAVGASILERAGFTTLVNVEGGITAWTAAGFQLRENNARAAAI